MRQKLISLGEDFTIEDESGQSGQNKRCDRDYERRHDRLGGDGYGAQFQCRAHQRFERRTNRGDETESTQRQSRYTYDSEHGEDQAHHAQQRWIGVARAVEPSNDRHGKQRDCRAIERKCRCAEDQPESEHAAHACAKRSRRPRESEYDIEEGNQRHGDHKQCCSAHGTRTRPRQRLLQPPLVQIDGKRYSDAQHLQQQQQPIRDRTRVDVDDTRRERSKLPGAHAAFREKTLSAAAMQRSPTSARRSAGSR